MPEKVVGLIIYVEEPVIVVIPVRVIVVRAYRIIVEVIPDKVAHSQRIVGRVFRYFGKIRAHFRAVFDTVVRAVCEVEVRVGVVSGI